MSAGEAEAPLHHPSDGSSLREAGRRPDWGEMLWTATRLGVGPEAFWRLSLREWRMLTERPGGVVPIGRLDFERMAEAWPDE